MSLENEINRYMKIAHSLQAAIKYKYNFDVNRNKIRSVDGQDDMKHEYHVALLRAGVTNLLCEIGALVDLLAEKGIFTKEEYFAKANSMLTQEVENYQNEISRQMGGVKVEFHGLNLREEDENTRS